MNKLKKFLSSVKGVILLILAGLAMLSGFLKFLLDYLNSVV